MFIRVLHARGWLTACLWRFGANFFFRHARGKTDQRRQQNEWESHRRILLRVHMRRKQLAPPLHPYLDIGDIPTSLGNHCNYKSYGPQWWVSAQVSILIAVNRTGMLSSK